MPIYFFSSSINKAESESLESSLRKDIPHLQKVANVEEMSRSLPRAATESAEANYIVFPFSQAAVTIERLVQIAERGRDLFFFIFISDDISASDYKQLVRTGNADWASSRGVPQEVLDIISRQGRGDADGGGGKPFERRNPILVSFLPSAGGVGNATLAIETAVQIKRNKAARERAICIVDLDFQTSHVCDLLDMDARLKIEEISRHPERLDAQLFELFVSHHASGVDVLATPRNKQTSTEANIAALDALFAMVSQRYDLILVDLPVGWVAATRQVLSVSDLVVVTGLDTIPGLRQVTDTVKAVRELEQPPSQIMVALNRCQAGLLGGVASRQYVKRMLETETVIYVRDHQAAAHESVNTGVPISTTSPSSKISKDVAKLTQIVLDLHPGGKITPVPAE